jgi:hypothetical protein
MLNEEGRRPSLLESLNDPSNVLTIKSDAVADWWTSPSVMRIGSSHTMAGCSLEF